MEARRMGTEHGLAVIPHGRPAGIQGPRLALPTREELEALQQYGEIVVTSGMAPKHVTTWQAAVVTMRYGHQLGIDEFTALNNIYLQNGKPAAYASLQHALILRDHGDDAIVPVELTPERVALRCRRRGSAESVEVSYTIAEARTAGLVATGSTWSKYPTDMLFARCVSRAGRMFFRDSTMGMYTPEEVGIGSVEVEGEVIDVAPAPPRRAMEPPSRPTRPASTAEVVDAATGEIIDAPVGEGRAAAMARLHAVGAERGLDHDGIHRTMVFLLPVMTTLGALSDGALGTLADRIETAGDEEVAAWSTDWEGEIAAAGSSGALGDVGKELKRVGITRETHKGLYASYNRRSLDLAAAARAAQDAAKEQAELAGMPADADKWTA